MMLAKKLGYKSPQFVCLMETGKSEVPAQVAGALVNILGIPESKYLSERLSAFSADLETQIEAGKAWAQQKGLS